MQTKMIEIRDSGTTIPALAIQTKGADETEIRFFRHCGYPRSGSTVILIKLNDAVASNDPYNWNSGARTMPNAHNYIAQNWDALVSGQVVDVQVILGERDTPKTAEVGIHNGAY